MTSYHIYGRPFAGSLIVEFMMREAGLAYTISFPDDAERATAEFRAKNPTSKIPVLVCPDGGQVYESLAIVQYLARYCPHLVPEVGSEAEKIYLSVLTMLGATMYPAYHRQHHTYQYGPENAYPEIQAMARSVNDSLYDYIESLLNPYICGAQLTAADLYLYMISRWNVDKTQLRASRPKLAHLIDTIRAHPTIEATLASQPRHK
jgi:glutathione S-transferase